MPTTTKMKPATEQFEIVTRGVVDCRTEADLKKKLAKSVKTGTPLRVKLGIDPSSPDIHVGHCVVLRKLRQFQDLGHRAVLIIGSATAMVGDPSERNKTRPQLAAEEVEAHAQTYLDQVGFILDSAPDKLEIVRNGDWFLPMTFADTLELLSRATVAQMLARDDFKKRVRQEKEIRLHEIMYPCMQGWDSVEVRADIELGGTDQLFNLLVGRDFQAQVGQPQQVCLMTPLLNGLDGRKMSKSYGNHIGITFAPEDVYGKVMALKDEFIVDYAQTLTDMALPDGAEAGVAPADAYDLKRELAREITTWLHDAEKAETAKAHFDKLFVKGGEPDEMPALAVPVDDRNDDGTVWICKLIVLAGFAKSNGEARRLVEGGGVTLDGARIDDAKANVPVTPGAVLKVGKRRFARLAD